MPLAASFLFAFLFVNSAFIAASGQGNAEALQFLVAVDGDVAGARFLDALEHQRFELEAKGVTAPRPCRTPRRPWA